MGKRVLFISAGLSLFLFLCFGTHSYSSQQGCLSCHHGLMPFTEGRMMQKIKALGEISGSTEACVVCHGGSPSGKTEKAAHNSAPIDLQHSGGPKQFYPNPGSTLVAEFTCGQCHKAYVDQWRKSLMATRAESMQRGICTWGWNKNKSRSELKIKSFGRYEVDDLDGFEPGRGTDAYKKYMWQLTSNPDMYADRLEAVGAAGMNEAAELKGAFGNIGPQQDCRNCHIDGEGTNSNVDAHGTGCSACHVPYTKEGTYAGNDPTIDKSKPGKLVVHRLQGTRNSRVEFQSKDAAGEIKNKEILTGIPVDSCFQCHYDLRQESLNPIGAVMTHYGTFRHKDMRALLCQDCHTTIEMHGDGNIPLIASAQLEVKCEDCHGTVDRAPWDLPLGYVQGNGRGYPEKARDLALAQLDLPGGKYDGSDGFLLTSRGNPFGNVIKDGKNVILHSAGGRDLGVKILKNIRESKTWKSDLARQAMFEVKTHREKMACTTCHADWAQPCLGCHKS